MDHTHSRAMATAVIAPCTMVVAACGPSSSGSGSSSGNVPSGPALTEGLLTGAIQGVYGVGLPTLDKLKDSGAVRVYLGPGWSSDVLEIASLKGVLGTLNVRRALSMALNRQAIINSVCQGAAQRPRWLSNPGTFGYGKSVFAQAYDSSPVLTQNITKARKQAGDPGKTITFGTTSQLAVVAGVTAAYLFSPWADQLGGTG